MSPREWRILCEVKLETLRVGIRLFTVQICIINSDSVLFFSLSLSVILFPSFFFSLSNILTLFPWSSLLSLLCASLFVIFSAVFSHFCSHEVVSRFFYFFLQIQFCSCLAYINWMFIVRTTQWVCLPVGFFAHYRSKAHMADAELYHRWICVFLSFHSSSSSLFTERVCQWPSCFWFFEFKIIWNISVIFSAFVLKITEHGESCQRGMTKENSRTLLFEGSVYIQADQT